MMQLCGDAGPLDFQNACVRNSWSAAVPAAFTTVFCCSTLAKHWQGWTKISSPLRTFLSISEAEALAFDHADGSNVVLDGESQVEYNEAPLWRTILLVSVGIAQAFFWIGSGLYNFVSDSSNPWPGILALLNAVSWLYATLRPAFRPTATAPLDLFSLYIVYFVSRIIGISGVVYDYIVFGRPFPATWALITLFISLASVLVLLVVVCGMPLALPSKLVKKEDLGVTVSLEDYCTLWGWITFSWLYPLIRLGRYKTLSEDDVWSLSPTLQSRPLFIKFDAVRSSTLLRKLLKANSLDLITDFCLTIISSVLSYAPPFFMKRILDIIDSEEQTTELRANAYIYAVLAFNCGLLRSQVKLQHLWVGRRAATRVRSQLKAAIYEKALKRRDFSGIIDKSKSTLAENEQVDEHQGSSDIGKIVNLMSGDADTVSMTVSIMYFLYGAPFEIVIGCLFLYRLLGWSAFAGFIVLVAAWPLNSFLARRGMRIHKAFLAARDKRTSVINEMLGSVKHIKFFALEGVWIRRALGARGEEIKELIKVRTNRVLLSVIGSCTPILISIVAFLVYVSQGQELTTSVAFTSIALFGMIRQPLNVIPQWIVNILQTLVGLGRIATYLREDEVSDQVSSLKKDRFACVDEDEGLGLDNATLKWNEVEERDKDKRAGGDNRGQRNPSPGEESEIDIGGWASASSASEDHRFHLQDVSVLFPNGQLSVVTGPTASGKTALLMALLGEMTLLKGKIIMSKNPSKVDEHGLMHGISYAAQTPWLRHQSIKENILFAYPYEEDRYSAVVECCALKPDLDILEDGDMTEIGSRGVNLSGGQKVRIALARAVYARTRYALLDDPLSAVDSHTARHLYERLLRGPLFAHRTVILVTHHIDLVLPGTYYLVQMRDGRIANQGTVKELQERGVLDHLVHEAAASRCVEECELQREPCSVVTIKPEQRKDPRKLVEDEHRETGRVGWSVYSSYLKASSYWIWLTFATLLIVQEGLGVSEKLWIRVWGEAYKEYKLTPLLHRALYLPAAWRGRLPVRGDRPELQHEFRNDSASFALPNAKDHPLFYVGVFALVGLTKALANTLAITVQFVSGLRASRRLFKELLYNVIRATFRFHDVTPLGRMLNRFGWDIETIDLSLPNSFGSMSSSVAALAASILTISFVFPPFLMPVFLIGFAYYQLGIGYLNTGRDLRRMESNSVSPIYSDFTELLQGIVTVRAFSAERRFFDGLHRKIDLSMKMWYTIWMTHRWLLLNFDVVGETTVLITTLFALSVPDAGLAGLCITSAFTFTGSIYSACRTYTELELDLNSMERISEYLSVPQEPPPIIENQRRPPAYWPSSNTTGFLVIVEKLVVKYAPDLPPVLHGISFSLKSREHVGVIGRTGSGKSTLAMSLLRFVDPASGRILIDGIDISSIGTYDLRSKLTFIPQDATLFSGTLRDNLDPFGEHTDSECLDVLFRVHLLSVSSTPSDTDAKPTLSLNSQVSSGGINFSHGQRQLVAMARALLRRSLIIIMDEATSSIDFDTDAKIQATIRQEFNDSLLLTIAHRLHTVIDYDRLIVLDNGRIAELGTPYELIQKENGIFRGMCLQSGTFSQLEGAAKAKHFMSC